MFFPFIAQVDEGIEAMLCCWLQQLQEFGGPEVDKPDLLKGSVGSLKTLGLATAAGSTSATATTSAAVVSATAGPQTCTTTAAAAAAAAAATFKPTSNTNSLLKHKSILDMRARYNVSSIFMSTATVLSNIYH